SAPCKQKAPGGAVRGPQRALRSRRHLRRAGVRRRDGRRRGAPAAVDGPPGIACGGRRRGRLGAVPAYLAAGGLYARHGGAASGPAQEVDWQLRSGVGRGGAVSALARAASALAGWRGYAAAALTGGLVLGGMAW